MIPSALLSQKSVVLFNKVSSSDLKTDLNLSDLCLIYFAGLAHGYEVKHGNQQHTAACRWRNHQLIPAKFWGHQELLVWFGWRVLLSWWPKMFWRQWMRRLLVSSSGHLVGNGVRCFKRRVLRWLRRKIIRIRHCVRGLTCYICKSLHWVNPGMVGKLSYLPV